MVFGTKTSTEASLIESGCLAFTLIEAISLVASAMGSQIYIHDTIFIRINFFSFGSITFSIFLRVFYLYARLVATIKLKIIKPIFARGGSVNLKISQFDGEEKGNLVIL